MGFRTHQVWLNRGPPKTINDSVNYAPDAGAWVDFDRTTWWLAVQRTASGPWEPPHCTKADWYRTVCLPVMAHVNNVDVRLSVIGSWRVNYPNYAINKIAMTIKKRWWVSLYHWLDNTSPRLGHDIFCTHYSFYWNFTAIWFCWSTSHILTWIDFDHNMDK